MILVDSIVALYRARGWRLAEKPGEVNICYVEGANENGAPNGNAPDAWNDRRIVFGFRNGVAGIVHNAAATSEPGRFYTDNPMNKGGVARIALGLHEAKWRVGTHNRTKPSAHEALVQCAEIAIHRDLNKDHSRAGDPVTMGVAIGLNQHHGWNMQFVGKASAGCLVGQNKTAHFKFLQLVKADPRYRADTFFAFDTAVFEAADLQPFLAVHSS